MLVYIVYGTTERERERERGMRFLPGVACMDV